ncbi:ribonuclease H-like [Carcharodon carcharias]|uniref:ribonuclease H-like n=1 Tax=Carcharodon carcharias TaxID=13397 RepID=UPI001B7D9596|nr:ribonuclease H-like [Carcharodon carcharias]
MYCRGRCIWKAVAFNPKIQTLLEGTDGSSQYAELKAVILALEHDQEGPAVHIYTDSWAVANGMAVWMPKWKDNQWVIHGKPLWGKDLWVWIWEEALKRQLYVNHVDAHMKTTIPTSTNNANVDEMTRVRAIEVQQFAQWAHQKSGHLGVAGT